MDARSTGFFFTPDWDLLEDGDNERETAKLSDPGLFLTFA